MTLFNLSWRNIKRSPRRYATYFLSIVLNVMIFYTFLAISDNATIKEFLAGQQEFLVVAKFSSILIVIFSVVFISSSTLFFFNYRRKEIGLYSLFGMPKRRLGALLALENFFISCGALTLGLLSGLVFTKLVLMLFMKVMLTSLVIPFTVSFSSVAVSVAAYALLFIFTSLLVFFNVQRLSLRELWQYDNKETTMKRGRSFVSLLGFVTLAAGYTIGFFITKETFLLSSGLTLLLTIIGTILLFSSLSALVVTWLKRNPAMYRRQLRLIEWTNLSYRIKSFSRLLTVTSLLIATMLTAILFTYSQYYSVQKISQSNTPFSLSYLATNEAVEQQVEDAASKQTKHKVKYHLVSAAKTIEQRNLPTLYFVTERDYRLVQEAKHITPKRALAPNETRLVSANSRYLNIAPPTVLQQLGLTIADKHRVPYANAFQAEHTFVVTDATWQKIKAPITRIHVWKWSLEEDSHTLTKQMILPLPAEAAPMSYMGDSHPMIAVFALALFIGALLGLVFFLSVAAILHFKVLMEVDEERQRYAILQKLGVTKTAFNRSVAKQLAIMFGVPLLVGTLHSIAAMLMAANLFDAKVTNLMPAFSVLAVSYVVFIAYYWLTYRTYIKIIHQ